MRYSRRGGRRKFGKRHFKGRHRTKRKRYYGVSRGGIRL